MRNFVECLIFERIFTVMKITQKSIIKLIVSLMIVVSLVLSMSSCGFDFSIEDIIDQIQNGNEGEGNGGNNIGGGNTNPDTNPDFYPNSGSASLENVSAENRTLLSTVSIIANFGDTPAAGSGVIYQLDKENGNAYIVTNYHVVYYDGLFTSCELYLYGMENIQYAIPATFVGGSVSNDIAVLKVTGSEVLKNSYAIAAPFADSEKVRVFDTAIAVGNPEGFGMSATTGIVSVESEQLDIEGADGDMIQLRVMRTDAAINLGNSGGGLYNENGEIIGIVCAKRIGEDVDNFGYAIPSNLAKNLVNNIIDNCNGSSATKAKRVLIGITIAPSVQGVIVNPETGEISQGHITAIDKISDTCIIADKIAEGDVINSVTIKGVKTVIQRFYQVPDTMLNARLGDTVIINVTRGNQTFDVSFTVTEAMFSNID